MFRKHFTVLLLAATVVAAGCQDERSSPAAPSGVVTASADAATINGLIEDLFDGGRENAALTQFRNVDRQLGAGETADAIGKAFDLIDFVLAHFDGDRLNDPNGGAPPTTDEAVAELISLILEFVGLDGGPIPPGALGPDGVVVICEAGALCNATSGDDRASFFIPAGVTEETTIVAVSPLSPFVNPFEPFGFDGFPLFRQFTAIPEIPTNGNGGLELAQDRPIVVELCVLDPPHSLAPPEEILSRLRIAHIVNEGEEDEDVDIAPLAEIPGGFERPDCTDVNDDVPDPEIAFSPWQGWAGAFLSATTSVFEVTPLYARPGRLGGAISAFSPFGAVDPESGGGEEATTTTLVLESTLIFDGGSTNATATVDPTPDGQGEPSVDFIIDRNTINEQTITKFLDDGEATISIECVIQFEPSGEADAEVGSGAHNVQAEFPGSLGSEASSSNIEILSCLQILE